MMKGAVTFMKFIVRGKNIEVTEALKQKVTKKLGKLSKFFNPGAEAQVTLSVEKNRQIVEVTIFFNGLMLRAEEATEDMYSSIDKVADILVRQIRKNKTRLEKKLKENAFKVEELMAEDDVKEEGEFKVVKSKKFPIKPMTLEEAILQMNLLGHEFFVFINADSKEVNVVYKRKDGDYGLIEPEY